MSAAYYFWLDDAHLINLDAIAYVKICDAYIGDNRIVATVFMVGSHHFSIFDKDNLDKLLRAIDDRHHHA